MKKGIVSIILVAVILTGILPFNVMAQDYIEEPIFDAEVNFLKTLGVTEEGFEPYFQMTRAEYVKMIAEVMYKDIDFNITDELKTVIFSDVSLDSEAYPYIKACMDLGIIKGNPDGYFRPDDFITISEAVAVTINALGYTLYAEAAGGYPTGYLMVARETGILNGLSESYNPTGYVLSKMLYNALFADLVTIDSVTKDNISLTVKNDSNILSARLGIEEYDALVVDNGFVSITGSSSIDDSQRVVLENMSDGTRAIVYTGSTDISAHLGSRVKAFVKLDSESGKNEIIYYTLHKKNTEILFNADDILGMDINEIRYEDREKDDGKVKKEPFASGGPVMVFNGLHVTGDISTYLPEDGFVKAIDYNSDGKIDFVNIISFNVKANDSGVLNVNSPARNIVVGKTDSEEKYIGCKFYPANGLNLEESNYIFILNNEVKDISDLKDGDIVSVAQSTEKIGGKFYYQLAVMRETVSGNIEAISSDSGKITVSGKEYEISTGLTSVKKGFVNYVDYNTDYTFNLDITGKVAYSKALTSGTKDYAYLIKARLKAVPDPELIGKFLTKEGEIKEYKFASKVTVDGVPLTDHSVILDKLKKREAGSVPTKIGAPSDIFETNYSRPVILKLNASEEVTGIDTDNLNYDSGTDFTYYSSETMIPYSQTEVEDSKALKAGYRSPRIEELTRYTSSLSGRFYVSEDSLVMMVPDIDVYGLDNFSSIASNKVDSGYNQPFKYNIIKLYENNLSDENYKIATGSSLERYFAYDIQGYDIDPDTGVAGLVVVRGNCQPYIYGRVPYDNTYPMQVYLKKAEVYDEEKEKTVTKIYYTTDGITEESAIVDMDETLYIYKYIINGCAREDTPYNMAYTPLKKGDIIRVVKSGQELTHIERVYHIDTIDKAYSAGLYPSFPRVMYSEALTGVVNLPSDERGYYAGFMSGYHLGVVYPKSISGTNLTTLIGKRYISDIDIGDAASYTMQSLNISDTSYLVVEIDEDGAVSDVREGTEGDIKTIDEYGIDEASILIYHNLYHQISKIIIVNRV